MPHNELINYIPHEDAIIENVARAIFCERNGGWNYKAWRKDPRISEAYRKDAKAAIAAYKESI